MATLAMYNFNHTPGLSGYSPYELLFGRKGREVVSKINITPVYTFEDYYDNLRSHINIMHEINKKITAKSRLEGKNYYDKKSKHKEFNVGDLVLMKNMQLKNTLEVH